MNTHSHVESVLSAPRSLRPGRPLAVFARLSLFAAATGCVSVVFPATEATAANIIANSAADVCASNVDPCVVTDTILVQSGVDLDFGVRTVQVRPGGSFDFDFNSGRILCGTLDIDLSGTATGIRMKGSFFGETFGGVVRVEARRGCSGDPTLPCIADSECAVQSVGTCSVGTGVILLNGKVVGNADSPGALLMRAADDISVTRVMNLLGSSAEADGGFVSLTSWHGNVVVASQVQLKAGGLGTGGDLEIVAEGDITVSASVDAVGGDFDGGTIDLDAGGSVTITQDLLANAGSGEGAGGFVNIQAGGDIHVSGGSASNRINFAADGSCCTDGSGGFGGTVSLQAGGNLSLSRYIKLEANGAPPDADGGLITLDSAGDLSIDSQLFSKGLGSGSFGGSIELLVSGNADLLENTDINVEGGDTGGDVDVDSQALLTVDGVINADGGVDSGSIVMIADEMVVHGSIEMDGGSGVGGGTVLLEACDMTLAASGDVANRAEDGQNTLLVRRTLTTQAGAQLRQLGAPVGENRVLYRLANQIPVFDPGAVVTPAASLIHTPSLRSCAVCGDGFVEAPETCDDGNLVDGDGCNAQCQDEGCIAQTPDYPTVPLCDDGNACTMDVCNTTTHQCEYTGGCDDGVDCTVDSCVAGTCSNTPDHTACDDGNVCTSATCSALSGCRSSSNAASCDDGIFCNGEDTCSGGTCSVHAGDPCVGGGECHSTCNELQGNCLAPRGTECVRAQRPCVDNICNGRGLCIHDPDSKYCGDRETPSGPGFTPTTPVTGGVRPAVGGGSGTVKSADPGNDSASGPRVRPVVKGTGGRKKGAGRKGNRVRVRRQR